MEIRSHHCASLPPATSVHPLQMVINSSCDHASDFTFCRFRNVYVLFRFQYGQMNFRDYFRFISQGKWQFPQSNTVIMCRYFFEICQIVREKIFLSELYYLFLITLLIIFDISYMHISHSRIEKNREGRELGKVIFGNICTFKMNVLQQKFTIKRIIWFFFRLETLPFQPLALKCLPNIKALIVRPKSKPLINQSKFELA